MSNIISGIAQKRIVGSNPRKSVLMLMAACASDDGTGVWTSKANMAADLEMSKRTVQAAINEMIEMGVVYASGRRPCRNGFTIEYGIHIPSLLALKCTRAGDAPVQEVHPTGAGDAPQDVQELHPNSPLTIHEPSFGSAEPPPPPKRKSRNVSIPENWVPNESNIAYAISKNFTNEEIQHEADQFHNHHIAKGTAFKNWDAGWRTWVGNAIKFRNRGMAGNSYANRSGQGGGLAGEVARRHS